MDHVCFLGCYCSGNNVYVKCWGLKNVTLLLFTYTVHGNEAQDLLMLMLQKVFFKVMDQKVFQHSLGFECPDKGYTCTKKINMAEKHFKQLQTFMAVCFYESLDKKQGRVKKIGF